MKDKAFIVTIDGPAGSGKSTVSARLATQLHLPFLTTGAFYRGLGLLCRDKKTDTGDAAAVARLAQYQGFSVRADEAGTQLFIDGVNRTDELNSEQVALVASRISAYSEVRQALLQLQRAFSRPPGLIAEGRDCGTVVFPEAQVKIFLTANLDTRAQRRMTDEKTSPGHDLTATLAHRDKADTSRKVAPLAKAADTIEIDSSTMTIDEVVAQIVALVNERRAGTSPS